MEQTLLEFPCDFPLKIVGETHPDFVATIVEVVTRHAPEFEAATITQKASSGGKYVSLTCTVKATSQEQLDGLYRELLH